MGEVFDYYSESLKSEHFHGFLKILYNNIIGFIIALQSYNNFSGNSILMHWKIKIGKHVWS